VNDYSIQVLPAFEGLKYSASMLAGLLVLAFTDTDRDFRQLDIERKVLDELARAEDIIRPITTTDRTAHCHHHLTNAMEAVRHVIECLHISADITKVKNLDHAVAQLRYGWEELRHVARNLPGFEMIDLSQSCCALHASRLQQFRCSG